MFCRKVVVAVNWNVCFPLFSPLSVTKRVQSTLTLFRFHRNMYFSRMLILASPQAMHGGVTVSFSCVSFIPPESVGWRVCIPLNCQCCGQESGGQGATRYGVSAAATRTTWQKRAFASTQISLWSWDWRHKPERKSFVITRTKPSWHSGLVHTV